MIYPDKRTIKELSKPQPNYSEQQIDEALLAAMDRLKAKQTNGKRKTSICKRLVRAH